MQCLGAAQFPLTLMHYPPYRTTVIGKCAPTLQDTNELITNKWLKIDNERKYHNHALMESVADERLVRRLYRNDARICLDSDQSPPAMTPWLFKLFQETLMEDIDDITDWRQRPPTPGSSGDLDKADRPTIYRDEFGDQGGSSAIWFITTNDNNPQPQPVFATDVTLQRQGSRRLHRLSDGSAWRFDFVPDRTTWTFCGSVGLHAYLLGLTLNFRSLSSLI